MRKRIIFAAIACSVVSAVALWNVMHTPAVSRRVAAATDAIPRSGESRPSNSTEKNGEPLLPRVRSQFVERADSAEKTAPHQAASPTETIIIKDKPPVVPSNSEPISSSSIPSATQSAETVQRRESLDVHVDVGACDACSNTKIRTIAISKSCEYDFHQITQLERIPYAPIATSTDEHTSYSEVVEETSADRISAVRLTVGATKRRDSTANPSITMRLTVFEKCMKSAG
jgi:hypothetical protein